MYLPTSWVGLVSSGNLSFGTKPQSCLSQLTYISSASDFIAPELSEPYGIGKSKAFFCVSDIYRDDWIITIHLWQSM